ncbi:MAG: methylated-DNA--[protein]-cysteine S-methyltransferase [Bradymonadales bacterium]|jgi:methylated-DNA-[protein]-cysteine S-methyltransferase
MIQTAFYPSTIAWIELRYIEQKLLSLALIAPQTWGGQRSAFSDKVYWQITEYFEGRRKSFDISYALSGTPFQLRVWNALCEIPYGETRSYKDIAVRIGQPKACRAVGRANHSNPIMIMIPCHRVIGANGALSGYAGGVEIKKKLLELEAQNR